MDRKQNYVYIVVILILFALLFSTLFRAYENYSIYREHKVYIQQPDSKIQDWMSIKTISTNFNLSSQEIFNEMGVNKTKMNIHISLSRFCKETHQNCAPILEKLNNLVGR